MNATGIYLPKVSIEFCRSMLRQTSPFSFMFGCQTRVLQCTFGGYLIAFIVTFYGLFDAL